MKSPAKATSKHHFFIEIVALALLIIILSPSNIYSQGTSSSNDSANIRAKIRQYTTLHSVGIGLCIGGAAATVGGLLVMAPTFGENEPNSVPNRNLGLGIMVGGLAVTMAGIVMVSQSGTRLRVLKQQQQGLSIGISPEPNAPGVVLKYRF